MDKTERNQLIEDYGAGYANLEACLASIPRDMWQFKPGPRDWSVHQIIVHLADSESNSFLRARRMVAEPGQSIMAYDQDVWADTLDYHSSDWENALMILKGVRQATYEFIRRLPDDVWDNTAIHPEFDEPYTMSLWLRIYARHIPGHIEQINDNHRLWLSQQG
jgi:hypothetical protein